MYIPIHSPHTWQEYELIDVGNFEKLEKFGQYITRRPEPQALWQPSLAMPEWEKIADATFLKDRNSPEKGQWQAKPHFKEHQWKLRYRTEMLNLQFKLSLSTFKHVGIFPEQAYNWEFIAQNIHALQQQNIPNPKILNLFAYTGAASLVAKQAGAEVTHVDSVKQVNAWAKENMELSQLQNIRWITEDALGFVKREVRRGSQYQGIILDPPAYGRGTDGEKWVLETHLAELLALCAKMLAPNKHFLVINLYSLGFSALILENLLKETFNLKAPPEVGELYLADRFEKKLPLGIYARFANI